MPLGLATIPAVAVAVPPPDDLPDEGGVIDLQPLTLAQRRRSTLDTLTRGILQGLMDTFGGHHE